MTEVQLRKALTEIMSEEYNKQYLFQCFEETDDMSDDEAIKWAVDRLYSENLLNILNSKLAYRSVCSMYVFGYDSGVQAVEYEQQIGHGIVAMPRVWPKRIVYLGGWNSSECGSNGFLMTSSGPTCYIDEDGEIVNLVEYRNTLQFSDMDDDKQPFIEYRYVAGAKDDVSLSLDGIEELLPEEFHGFWDT